MLRFDARLLVSYIMQIVSHCLLSIRLVYFAEQEKIHLIVCSFPMIQIPCFTFCIFGSTNSALDRKTDVIIISDLFFDKLAQSCPHILQIFQHFLPKS